MPFNSFITVPSRSGNKYRSLHPTLGTWAVLATKMLLPLAILRRPLWDVLLCSQITTCARSIACSAFDALVCLRSLLYNYISNCRGRGFTLRASTGNISYNTIEHVAYHGIELTPSFGAREGGFIRDTVVSPSLMLEFFLFCLNSVPRWYAWSRALNCRAMQTCAARPDTWMWLSKSKFLWWLLCTSSWSCWRPSWSCR